MLRAREFEGGAALILSNTWLPVGGEDGNGVPKCWIGVPGSFLQVPGL